MKCQEDQLVFILFSSGYIADDAGDFDGLVAFVTFDDAAIFQPAGLLGYVMGNAVLDEIAVIFFHVSGEFLKRFLTVVVMNCLCPERWVVVKCFWRKPEHCCDRRTDEFCFVVGESRCVEYVRNGVHNVSKTSFGCAGVVEKLLAV